MTFVGQPFNHDVFVSYSHGDTTGAGDALLSQWSQSFIKELEKELQFAPDAGSMSIFLDQHHRAGQALDPSQPLAKALQTNVANAAMLLVLMSPHYVQSEWCRQERVWWGETRDKHGLDPWNRVSYARLLPVDNALWPKEFVDEGGNPPVGHALFDQAADNPRPLNWPIVDHTSAGEVRRIMVELAGELRKKLLRVREQIEKRDAQLAALAKLAAPADQVVYLHGRESDASDWLTVRDKLMDEKFSVLPTDPEPLQSNPQEAARMRDDRVAIMSGCDAILLLGTEDRYALNADLQVIGRLDRQQAIARSQRPLPCSVLDTRGVISRRPDWPRVARSLGVQWLNATLENVAPQIRGWLSGIAA